MTMVNMVSAGAFAGNHNIKTRSEADDAVSKFDEIFQDSYIKKKSGNYTPSDQKRLVDCYERTAETVDDLKRFTGYYGYLCKTYGLFGK